jgi:hypothetical protein
MDSLERPETGRLIQVTKAVRISIFLNYNLSSFNNILN